MSEESSLEARRLERERTNAAARRKTAGVVKLLGASPPEAQLGFLRHLLDHPDQAAAFVSAPEAYAARYGVVVDPDVVRGIVDTTVFGEPISDEMVRRLGPQATASLLDVQGDGRLAALPIAVAAAVAVASAAVALVANSAEAMSASELKGFAMPGRAQGSVAASSAVIYATTAITSSSTVVAAARDNPGGFTAAGLRNLK